MTFLNTLVFYNEVLLAPHPDPKLEDHPLSFVRGRLFNIFAVILHTWRLSLHPQPEDAPCCGDKKSHYLAVTIDVLMEMSTLYSVSLPLQVETASVV
jgi:hypothetical protein